MTDKWINLGDKNHREEGGQFVQVDTKTETVEVVTVDNLENSGTPRFTRNQLGQIFHNNIYYLQEAEYTFDELREYFSKKNGGVYNYAGWERLEGRKFDDIVMELAVDLISYQGGSTEGEAGSNYWRLLGYSGINRNNIIS
jgi:hypothetical protein